MEEIVFVTHNKGKIETAKKHLKNVNFKVFEYDLEEPRSDDIKYISEVKVKEAYKLVKKPCISMDSGFFIEALNGFPRAFVNHALETIGIEGILKLMEDKQDRNCYFGECLSYYDGKELHQFMGKHEGSISTQILGNDTNEKWSDLWYIYIPKNYQKTLAQMTKEERSERNKKEDEYSISSMKVFAKWYLEKKQE